MFPQNTKILIVEDLKTIRTLLMDFLGQLGYVNLHEAEKGDDGLILLKEAEENGKPFELIFCDWNMPKFSGIDLLKAKNADPALKKIPFLMVTVENERDYIMKAVALGVDDYILKPFTVKTIEAKLQSVWLRAHVR